MVVFLEGTYNPGCFNKSKGINCVILRSILSSRKAMVEVVGFPPYEDIAEDTPPPSEVDLSSFIESNELCLDGVIKQYLVFHFWPIAELDSGADFFYVQGDELNHQLYDVDGLHNLIVGLEYSEVLFLPYSYSFSICFWNITRDTSVMINYRTDVITLFTMRCPGSSFLGFSMNNNLCTWR